MAASEQNPYQSPRAASALAPIAQAPTASKSIKRGRHRMFWSGVVLLIIGVLIISLDPAFATDVAMWTGFITCYGGLAVMLVFGFQWARQDATRRAQTVVDDS